MRAAGTSRPEPAPPHIAQEDDMPAVSRTTYVFTVLHPTDQPPSDLEEALREAFDGHSVGAVVHEVTGPVPDEAVPGALVELGNDGMFFDDDLARSG